MVNNNNWDKCVAPKVRVNQPMAKIEPDTPQATARHSTTTKRIPKSAPKPTHINRYKSMLIFFFFCKRRVCFEEKLQPTQIFNAFDNQFVSRHVIELHQPRGTDIRSGSSVWFKSYFFFGQKTRANSPFPALSLLNNDLQYWFTCICTSKKVCLKGKTISIQIHNNQLFSFKWDLEKIYHRDWLKRPNATFYHISFYWHKKKTYEW